MWNSGLAILFACLSFISLIISKINSSVLFKYDLYSEELIKKRPYGLRNSEMRKIMNESNIVEVKEKIRRTIRYKNIGLTCFALIPVAIIIGKFINRLG